MGSPPYQSEEDTANEEGVAELIEKMTNLTKQKLSASEFCVDYVFHRKLVPVYLVEVKCRKNPVGAYPDLMISANKIRKGQQLSEYMKIPFFLAIRWTDRTAIRKVENDERFQIKIGGRPPKARNDVLDVEPCCMIPIDDKWKVI